MVVAIAFRHAHYVPIYASPSLPVLGFAFLLSLLTGGLFGIAPAWLATRADPAEALRGANRSTKDHASWSQKSLVIVQATLSVVLLVGAGLLTRSLMNLQHQELRLRARSSPHAEHQRAVSRPIRNPNWMRSTVSSNTACRRFQVFNARPWRYLRR